MDFIRTKSQRFSGTATEKRRAVSLGAKHLMDFVIAICLLPIIAPVIAVLYAMTRLDGGPGFFGHKRVGKDNNEFCCWKIRSMVPDAEAVLERHLCENPAAAAEWARDFKLANDPRITRLGRFLRQTSLDELPQIWNVLRGDMSFVGPRPVTRKEIEKYRGYEWCYMSVKPGITGIWQISGRNDVDYDQRVQMDVDYVTSRSLFGDLLIMFRTAGTVLNRTGR